MSGPDKKRRNLKNQDDWERVISAAAQLQHFVPDAVLVGGTAAALHAEHRFSYDDDHVVVNLAERFQNVLEHLEAQAGWETSRIQPPVMILGNLAGIDTGIRNLIRTQPLETESYESKVGTIVLPTLGEMARIKAWLIITRNATRDYIDFVALADKIEKRDGPDAFVSALTPMDHLYPQKNGASPLLQLTKQLAEPKPHDLGSGDISAYHLIAARWREWQTIKDTAIKYGVILLSTFQTEGDKRHDDRGEPNDLIGMPIGMKSPSLRQIEIGKRHWKDASRFARFARKICREYAALRASNAVGGVRFLYGPASSLNEPNGVVILGINPGGETDLSDRLCAEHTGYYSETWTSSDYRNMVCDLIAQCFMRAGAGNWESAWDRCVTSNLIPFRSPSLAKLANPKRCKDFGRELWREVFGEIAPRIVITFGEEPRSAVLTILREAGANPRRTQIYQVPRSTAALWAFDGERGEGRALLLPHYAHGHGVRSPKEIRAIVHDLAPWLKASLAKAGQARPQTVPRIQQLAPVGKSALSEEDDWRQEALSRNPGPGWKRDIIERIPFKRHFCVDDIFAVHGEELQMRHPRHTDVRGGITTVLGSLTRDGIVVRLHRGRYTPARNGQPAL